MAGASLDVLGDHNVAHLEGRGVRYKRVKTRAGRRSEKGSRFKMDCKVECFNAKKFKSKMVHVLRVNCVELNCKELTAIISMKN